MPRERVTMRKIREILRLVWLCSQSRRDTARTCGVCKSTVDATIIRATAAGFSWPLPSDLDDEALERRLYPPSFLPRIASCRRPTGEPCTMNLPNTST